MTCKASTWEGRGTACPDTLHGENCELGNVNGAAWCPWQLPLGQQTFGSCFGPKGAGRGAHSYPVGHWVSLLLRAMLDNGLCFGESPSDTTSPPNPAIMETASRARTLSPSHLPSLSTTQNPSAPPSSRAASLCNPAVPGWCQPLAKAMGHYASWSGLSQLEDLSSALWEGGSSPEWLGGPGHLLAPPGQAAHLCLQWPVAVAAEDGHAAGTGMLLPLSPLAASEPADPAALSQPPFVPSWGVQCYLS